MPASAITSYGAAVPDPEEVELVAGLRAGSDVAFEKFVRTYGGCLLSVAGRILGNDEDAQDAVQDALLSAVRGIQGFNGQARVYTWVHRIVANAALMRLRRRRLQERPIDDLLPRFLDDGHRDVPLGEWNEPVGAAIEREETRQLVAECIKQLPESYRIVLTLRDLEELDTAATAQLLGVSVGVVKTRLHRARQALRTLLDPHFRGDQP